jgi:hypothetical protein
MAKRTAIPKDVRNQVLVNAMHRCCLCPEHHDVVDLHHVILVSEGGPNTKENLMAVCPTCHAKIHRIRKKYSVEQLQMYKERWEKLCALGLPLDARIAQAFDTTRPPPQMPPGIPLLPLPYFAHPYPLQANFTGRVKERRMLTQWLAGDGCPVLAVIAIGGMGKSALTWAWVQRDVLGLPLPGEPADACAAEAGCRVDEAARPKGVLWWSFYERESRFAKFVDEALIYASGGEIDPAAIPSTHDKARALVSSLERRRVLLVLDGFERALRAYAGLGAAYQGD